VLSHRCSCSQLPPFAVLEIIKARWGTTSHLVFMFFAFCTNILVSSMLILGGAAVVNALTGMDIYAVCLLLMLSVVAYAHLHHAPFAAGTRLRSSCARKKCLPTCCICLAPCDDRWQM
jgi:amino acid transporter